MAMLQGIKGANAISERTGITPVEKLPAGGYVCKILNVDVQQTQNGSTFIQLRFDIQEGNYAAHFTKLWKASEHSQYERKWKGTYKIFLPVFRGDDERYKKAIAFYKGQVHSICRSNGMPEVDIEAGYDPDIFKGKLVGILFREAEYDVNGHQGTFTEPAFLAEVETIRSGAFRIPEMRRLQPTRGANGNLPQDYQPTTQNAAQSPQHSYAADVGDLSEFETILSNGDDPFLF